MFRRISPKQAIVVLTAVAVSALAGAELLHRILAPPESIPPRWSPEEFEARVESIDPARDCLFVGDSRTGWGVAEGSVTKALHTYANAPARAINLGMAGAGIEDILGYLRRRVHGKGGILMVHYSPAAFFWYSAILEPPPKPTANTAIQLSDFHPEYAINRYFNLILTTNLPRIQTDWLTLMRAMEGEHRPPSKYWATRTVFPEGFVNGQLVSEDGKPIDFAKFQLDTYRKTFREKPKPDAVRDLASAFRGDGWRVVMFRLPIGPKMQALENTLPPEMQPASLAAALGIPFIDFQADPRTRAFQTQDQSHLSPDSARAIAPFLADACVRVWTHAIQ